VIQLGALPPRYLATAVFLGALSVQTLVGIALFAFAILGRRDAAPFLPLRDYCYFADRHYSLWERHAD